jgi:hypothetical protein
MKHTLTPNKIWRDHMHNSFFKFVSLNLLAGAVWVSGYGQTYAIAGTGQTNSFNNTVSIALPAVGQSFYGQNANHTGTAPSYTDNSNGTITDNVTGLMWEKSTDKNGDGIINYYDKYTYAQALANASSCNTGGYIDWRLPTIKEQYSLIMYYGAEPNPTATSQGTAVPYINTDYFTFGFGDLNSSAHGATSNERLIDAQYATSTLYVSTTMGGNTTMFGVNFADGRIKGYPANTVKKYYVLYCRGNTAYGNNNFIDNSNGTITDNATGLMWMQNDNGSGILWEDALSYAENLSYAGYSDWRLPDAKELQSILDYSRSPATTNSAAINPLFNCTKITNEADADDYPFYWSSTTFCSQTITNGNDACYVSFGRAMGYMSNLGGWIDVHGAGAQRSDPKTGNSADFPTGFGPQGDAIRINNFVRCVRNVSPTELIHEKTLNLNRIPKIKIWGNPSAQTISFFVRYPGKTTLNIYSLNGILVAKIEKNFTSAGFHSCKIPEKITAHGMGIALLQNGNDYVRQPLTIIK